MPHSQALLEEGGSNQSPAFEDINLYSTDAPLRAAMARAGVDAIAENLAGFGRDWGSAESFDNARLANENGPKLRLVDGKGNRIDRVEFHPAYHSFMQKSMSYGIHSSPWEQGAGPRAMTARGARLYMAVQVEAGHMCPITMTNACVGALAATPEIQQQWLPKITARAYDPAFKPWAQKTAVTLGMGMTERQGGTDVRANLTQASASGDAYEITGHKWFMSAPMCDAFLVLAQAQGGLSCFLMPRFRPDGSLNDLRFRRLKSKLGNISNASSEVEFHSAYAQRLGAEGQGVRTIIEMVQLTRLDCALSSAGMMRQGLAQAMHHTRHRSVFQRRLADQPAMRAVLSDMALESEAMTALVFRLASAFDDAAKNEGEAAYARLMTPAIKYLVCKTAPAFIYEAMECFGGNGYVEELPMARLYREAPLNAIWEGSGNVMALDILRAAMRDPEATGRVIDGMAQACDGQVIAGRLIALLHGRETERHARTIAELLAKLGALAALAQTDGALAQAYRETRCEGAPHMMFGACDLGGVEGRLLERVLVM